MFTVTTSITRDAGGAPIAATATIVYLGRPVATFIVDPYEAVLLRNDRDTRDAFVAAKMAALFTVLTATEEAK